MKTLKFPTMLDSDDTLICVTLHWSGSSPTDCVMTRVTEASDGSNKSIAETITDVGAVREYLMNDLRAQCIRAPIDVDACSMYGKTREAWHRRTAAFLIEANELPEALLSEPLTDFATAFERTRKIDVQRIAENNKKVAEFRTEHERKARIIIIKQHIGALKSLGIDVSCLKVPD